MNKEDYSPQEYLAHIYDSIEKIESYVDGSTKAEFFTNSMMQDAVIRNFEIIGEASNYALKTYPVFFKDYKNLSETLIKAYQTRNAVIHGYIEVDYDIIWKTINKELPKFKVAIIEATHEIKPPNPESELER